MNRQELISGLIEDTLQVKKYLEEVVDLNIEELSFTQSPEQWSVLQCIEHLNIADSHYLMQFEKKFPQAKPSTIEEFKSGFLGDYMVRMMKPTVDSEIPSPMKTFRKFRPSVDVKYDTIDKFLEDQDKIILALEHAKTLDLNKNKIPSALGSIIMFKLGDAFRFLIGHNQRHVIQIKNILAEKRNLQL